MVFCIENGESYYHSHNVNLTFVTTWLFHNNLNLIILHFDFPRSSVFISKLIIID